MKEAVDILDVVALTENLPERGLRRGQVGTVVETLAPHSPKRADTPDQRRRSHAALTSDPAHL